MEVGWTRTEINEMTLPEIKTFIASATKKSAHRQIQAIIATAVGAQGDKKGIDRTIQQLASTIEEINNGTIV